MTDREILSNAMDKAIANGMKWHNDKWNPFSSRDSHPYDIWIDTEIYKIFIFSHSFAKYFWSKKEVCLLDGSKLQGKGKFTECIGNKHFEWHSEFLPEWEYHLMMMVREENPIKYLEKFL